MRGGKTAKGIGGVLTGMREKVEGGGKWRRTSEPAREWEVVNRLNAEGYPKSANLLHTTEVVRNMFMEEVY